jgi:hypothetical protein
MSFLLADPERELAGLLAMFHQIVPGRGAECLEIPDRTRIRGEHPKYLARRDALHRLARPQDRERAPESARIQRRVGHPPSGNPMACWA